MQDRLLAKGGRGGQVVTEGFVRGVSYEEQSFQSLQPAGSQGGVCKMRIRDTDRRQRHWEALKDATGENTTSGAIDVAVRYYLAMHGDSAVAPTGAIEELMTRATKEGSVTAAEVAEVLDVDELPVEYTEEWGYGRDS